MFLHRRTWLRVLSTAVPVTVLVGVLTACEGVAAGQEAARDACAAYAKAERARTGITAGQADAALARARHDARLAAGANATWGALQRDIEEFSSRGIPPQPAGAEQLDAYAAADRRVQDDCTAAGRDIGPRRP